jgi:ketosteroid isomerase-like protein
MLFEDTFVIRDRGALAALFAEEAVLVVGPAAAEARGDEIVRSATALWERDFTYVADPRRVLQARDTALVLAERSLSVVRRGRDGRWRYAISLLNGCDLLQVTQEVRAGG